MCRKRRNRKIISGICVFVWSVGKLLVGKYDINADNVHKILQDEIGDVFAKILECAGVYKRDEAGKAAFLKFVDYVNAR